MKRSVDHAICFKQSCSMLLPVMMRLWSTLACLGVSSVYLIDETIFNKHAILRQDKKKTDPEFCAQRRHRTCRKQCWSGKSRALICSFCESPELLQARTQSLLNLMYLQVANLGVSIVTVFQYIMHHLYDYIKFKRSCR